MYFAVWAITKKVVSAGLDVRGGGPASRESQLLNPLMSAQMVHAIVLSGGSAYGLGVDNGVMAYLEEQVMCMVSLFSLLGLPFKTRIFIAYTPVY